MLSARMISKFNPVILILLVVAAMTLNIVVFSPIVKAEGPTYSRIYTPSGTSGGWNDASNWSPNGVPGENDNVLIPGGLEVIISEGADVSVRSIFADGTITINKAVNQAPVAVNDSYSTNEDTALNVAVPGVLGNDTGNGLIAAMASNPAHGTLTLNADGSFIYTPTANYNGPDSFTYKANDGPAESNTTTVTITIYPVNDPPSAIPDFYSTNRDTTLTVNAPGVLSNDKDIDGDILTAIKVRDPDHGTLTPNPDGSFIYVPNSNYVGSDGFTYKAKDGILESDQVSVNLDIKAAPGKIVFSSDRDGNFEIYVMDDSGSNQVKLTNNNSSDKNPVWSPDGSKIAFETDRDGNNEIYIMNADGTNQIRLTNSTSSDYNPVWSPDGEKIAFRNSGGVGTRGIYIMNVDGSNQHRLSTDDSDSAPSWSPDGTKIAVHSKMDGGLDNDIYALKSDGTGWTKYNNNNTEDLNPAWSPDGNQIVFNINTSGSIGIYKINADGSSTSPTQLRGNAYEPAWSPEGTRIAFDADYTPLGPEICVQNLNDLSFKRLTDNTANDSSPSWTWVTSVAPTVSIEAASNVTGTQAQLNANLSTKGTAFTVFACFQYGTSPNLYTYQSQPQRLTTTGHFQSDISGLVSATYFFRVKVWGNGTVFSTPEGTFTIQTENQAPVAVTDTYNTNEGTALNIAPPGVLGNDTDPEGNALTAIKVTDPPHGTLTFNADGSFTYTPAANYNGPDSFTYKANDGSADSNTITVTITVNAINDAPVANAQSLSTSEDTPLAITLTGSDIDNVTLNYVVVSGPAQGIISGTAPNITFTPALNYNGSDSIVFKTNDGTADSNSATVTITVNAINDAPVSVNDSYSTDQDKALTVNAPGVLTNDSDIEANPLTAIKVIEPTHGAVALNGNGSFTYTPNVGYSGSDSFTYKANDGVDDSLEATVTITINKAVNQAPVAVTDTYNTNEDTALNVAAPGVLGNDTDPEGNALTAIKVTDPPQGTLTLNADGSCTYTPAANYNGPDSFTYKANDGSADSNTITVTITVNPVNDAPVANAQSLSTSEDTPLAITLTGSDIDSVNLNYVVVSGPAQGIISGTAPNITFTPALNYNGSDSIVFKTNDGSVDSIQANITITINAVNDPPIAVNDSYSTDQNKALIVNAAGVLANDSDIEGNTLTAIKVSDPSHGAVTFNSNGSFTYTPSAGYSGSDSFTYKANDGSLDSKAASVALTITESKKLCRIILGSFPNPSDFGKPTKFIAVVLNPAIGDSLNVTFENGQVNLGTISQLIFSAGGIPKGTVVFKDGEALIGSATLNKLGIATLSNSSLGIGKHNITAEYSGDTTFSGSVSATLIQSVFYGTSTSLTSSVNPTVFGQSIHFTATVKSSAGTPTGMVIFKDASKTLGTVTLTGNTAIFTTSSLPVGNHRIIATYSGDASYDTSSDSMTQSVKKVITSTKLTSSLNPAIKGQSITFTATVGAVAPGAGIPSGKVTFKEGNTTLGIATLNASGQAVYSITSLSRGTHNITAVYGGDDNFSTGTSTALAQKVN